LNLIDSRCLTLFSCGAMKASTSTSLISCLAAPGWPLGTDPNSATRTRRGTGYYKVPSLKGVWYRGMFGHNGWCATLEDWLDPRRTRDDYVPTGFKPYNVKTYAVKGHPFGLTLAEDDRKALIAFLKTL
jgi:hypothetical protein